MKLKTLCQYYGYLWAKVIVYAFDSEKLFEGTIAEVYNTVYCNKKIHSFKCEEENVLEIHLL